MSTKARSLVFLGPSDGEKVLLCFKWGVLNYALECRLDGVQNHSRSRPYPCTRAFSDGVGWPSPLLHGREDFWVIIVFCCWVGILCVCFQVDIVLHWLPIAARIKFKALMFAYRTTSGSAPLNLNSLLQTYVPSRSLRSASERRITVPSQRGTKSLSQTFSLTVPIWWNDLPNSIRAAESLHL